MAKAKNNHWELVKKEAIALVIALMIWGILLAYGWSFNAFIFVVATAPGFVWVWPVAILIFIIHLYKSSKDR